MAQAKFINRYSRLDRLLHRAAFSSGGLQVSLADVEDKIFRKQLADVQIERPVFVTALPRAGTTMLLSLLNNTGEFVSHSYRSMPFVLCPILWQRFSRRLRSHDHHEMERAHGDGISISIDSPEAFEEIIWSYFWKPHYRENHIKPWGRYKHPEFVNFLESHVRKQLLIAHEHDNARYLSKNNLNIARLGYIESIFPDALFVIPFRSPLQHASSLLKQHLGFLKTHHEDKFAKDYMRGVGHYDFGDNFLPINFDDWLKNDRRADATTLTFWVEYWIAAYRSILRNPRTSVSLVAFERLTQHPEKVLESLSGKLELRDRSKLIDQHKSLRNVPTHEIDYSQMPEALLKEANALFENLNALSISD
jgi:hypothetical protein